MDLFLLKKIITLLIMPITIIVILLLLALIFHRKRPSLSFKYLSVAVLLLVITSLPPISDQFMVSIEGNYQPFSRSIEPVDYIVVLGNNHTTNNAFPVTTQLSTGALQRMVEAIRIYKLHPEARIITSGFAGSDSISKAEKVKQALVVLGIPAQKIITENFPKDTEEEAQLISPRVLGTNVVLITNANHMPRAIKYFQTEGVNPIPAPTGYWVKNPAGKKDWVYYFPSSKKLQQTSVAWYESIGRLVQWLKATFT